MQQKLAQLLSLQLATCSLKAFFLHCKWKEVKSSAQIFNLIWYDKGDWIYECRFCSLTGYKNDKFFFNKREKIFCIGKILPTQTSNLAICLSIYVYRMPTRMARVEWNPIKPILVWVLSDSRLTWQTVLKNRLHKRANSRYLFKDRA